jgi:nucleoside-diphosphate-sugar epimerase
MTKTILIAGAGGFIGGHLVGKLLSQGFRVRAVDIKPQDDWYQVYLARVLWTDPPIGRPGYAA